MIGQKWTDVDKTGQMRTQKCFFVSILTFFSIFIRLRFFEKSIKYQISHFIIGYKKIKIYNQFMYEYV